MNKPAFVIIIRMLRRQVRPLLVLLPALVVAGGCGGGGVGSAGERAIGWGQSPYSAAPANATGLTAISTNYHHTIALTHSGRIMEWGTTHGTAPSGLNGVIAVAAGVDHDLAVLSDLTVVAWGDNTAGQSTVPGG